MSDFVFDDDISLGDIIDLPSEGSATDLDDLLQNMRDLRDEPGIEFPALLISGVLFRDCLEVLKSAKKTSYREVDLWLEDNDGSYHCLGKIQLDSTILLLLRYLRISAVIYYDRENSEALDLNNPEVIERFV